MASRCVRFIFQLPAMIGLRLTAMSALLLLGHVLPREALPHLPARPGDLYRPTSESQHAQPHQVPDPLLQLGPAGGNLEQGQGVRSPRPPIGTPLTSLADDSVEW